MTDRDVRNAPDTVTGEASARGTLGDALADDDLRNIGASFMEALARYARTQPGGKVFYDTDPVEVFEAALSRHDDLTELLRSLLAPLRELAGKATPGPWVLRGQRVNDLAGFLIASTPDTTRENAAFIVALVNAYPTLAALAPERGTRDETSTEKEF